MKAENAALSTDGVFPQATDAHSHQTCHHSKDDKAGDILADKKVKNYTYVYTVCPEGIESCNMKKIFTEEDTRYKKHWTKGQCWLSPLQSRHLGTSPSSPNCNQLPHRIFLNLINSLKSLSEVILVLGKGRSHRARNLGWSGAESLG